MPGVCDVFKRLNICIGYMLITMDEDRIISTIFVLSSLSKICKYLITFELAQLRSQRLSAQLWQRLCAFIACPDCRLSANILLPSLSLKFSLLLHN